VTSQPLTLIIDGVPTIAADVTEDLPRAVLISLFTWRRANPDDDLPGTDRYGWWGDTYPTTDNDRIGSRLWLLTRSKLTAKTVLEAKEYAEEALQWFVDDGVAAKVEVQAERQGLSQLVLGVVMTRGDKSLLNIRFANVWDYLTAF
jgi:phage gp46-like protein